MIVLPAISVHRELRRCCGQRLYDVPPRYPFTSCSPVPPTAGFRQATVSLSDGLLGIQFPDVRRLTYDAPRYTLYTMIRSFRCKETEKVFRRTFLRQLPRDIQRVALRKLRMLNRAMSLTDLRVPPANRLERLKGDRQGQYSIRINDQWRVCFEWRHADAYNVETVDYH